MGCVPPTVMNNHVTCFRLLTHLGVSNIWATGVLNKNRLRKWAIVGDKQPQKKKCGRFGERTSSKKSSATLTVVDFNENRRRCTLFLLNFLNLRDLLGVRIKLQKNIFKNNNQTNLTVTTRAGFFSKGWTRAFPSARLVSEWKNGSGPCLLKCSLFRCKMLFFRMQGCCIILAKMKSMSLCLSYLIIFLKYWKEGRSASSHVGV